MSSYVTAPDHAPSRSSEDDSDFSAPLGHTEIDDTPSKTIAQGSVRESLIPAQAGITALEVTNHMRLQHQSAGDTANDIHTHGSIDESSVSTDDESRGSNPGVKYVD